MESSCMAQLTEITDLTNYSVLPNGLVFMSNTYSCLVGLKITLLLSLRTARNKFVQENMGI
jgi:hypothetical protein